MRSDTIDLERWPAVFITARMLARYWAVDIETIYRHIRKGTLKAYRLPGGSIRIKREDALSYVRPLGYQ
jgi:excisionase family DNA binding protein